MVIIYSDIVLYQDYNDKYIQQYRSYNVFGWKGRRGNGIEKV